MKKSFIYVLALAVAIIIAAILFALNSSSASASANYDNVVVSQAITAKMQAIAENQTLANGIGTGIVGGFPTKINASALTAQGKPEMLYIGADYCPFCSITRWGLIIALMRFGNFSKLHYMTSSIVDSYPGTATFTFYNSTYQSAFINFTGVEEFTNQYNANISFYNRLQQPTASESNIFDKYDPQQGTPFLDFGNRSISLGALVTPESVKGLNWTTIVSKIDNPSTNVSQAIIGSANVYTAEICVMINNSAPVCSYQYVKNIERGI
jgi:hypothetical protein